MFYLFVFGEREGEGGGGGGGGGGGEASIEHEMERCPTHASCVLLVPTDYFNIETPSWLKYDRGTWRCR